MTINNILPFIEHPRLRVVREALDRLYLIYLISSIQEVKMGGAIFPPLYS